MTATSFSGGGAATVTLALAASPHVSIMILGVSAEMTAALKNVNILKGLSKWEERTTPGSIDQLANFLIVVGFLRCVSFRVRVDQRSSEQRNLRAAGLIDLLTATLRLKQSLACDQSDDSDP